MEKVLFVTRGITQTSSTDLEGIGTLRWVGNKLFRWVQNISGGGFVVGDVVSHDYTTVGAGLNYIQGGVTADLGNMGGVVMAATLADDDFGWIQVKGANAATKVDGTGTAITVGCSLMSANGTTKAVEDKAMGVAPIYMRYLIALEASTADETIETLVCCF